MVALVMVTVARVVTALAQVTVTAVRVAIIGNSISDAGVQVVKKAILGSAFMGRGYLVASSGNVTDEVWNDCINNRAPVATGISRWRIRDVSPELTD